MNYVGNVQTKKDVLANINEHITQDFIKSKQLQI